jgi:hypothetical protein
MFREQEAVTLVADEAKPAPSNVLKESHNCARLAEGGQRHRAALLFQLQILNHSQRETHPTRSSSERQDEPS